MKLSTWPQGAKAAALITVNLDAEQFWLGMFEGAQRRPKTLSMGEYGINRGLDRVLRALRDCEIRATFFTPGMVVNNHPGAIEKILADGHELAFHGHTHRPMHLMSLDQQREEFELGLEAFGRVAGLVPAGFRAPEGELSAQTLKIAADMGFGYSSSLYADDRPYRHGPEAGGLVEIPMNWNLHDFPYFAFNYGPAFPIGQGRVSCYQRVLENYLEELDAYRHYGLCYVAQFTPQTIGSPGKIPILNRVLEGIRSATDVWTGSCADLIATMQPAPGP
jgi:peptidoglycan/xylan/chitin deacetylase (PgdA/CDA1 family)